MRETLNAVGGERLFNRPHPVRPKRINTPGTPGERRDSGRPSGAANPSTRVKAFTYE